MDLSGFSAAGVRLILEYAYLGELELRKLSEVLDVFVIADYLNIADLKMRCEYAILNHFLNSDTAVEIALFFTHYSISLNRDSLKCLQHHMSVFWSTIIKQNGWTKLPFHVFHSVIASSSLNVRNEDQVLDCVLSWIAANSQQRHHLLVALLHNVQIHMLSPGALARLQSYDQTVPCTDFQRILAEGEYFAKYRRQLKLKHRRYYENSLWIIGNYKESLVLRNTNYNTTNSDVLMYSSVTQQWFGEMSFPYNWGKTVVATSGDQIFLIGGKQWIFTEQMPLKKGSRSSFDIRYDYFDRVLRIDVTSMEMSVMSQTLPFGIRRHSAGVVNNSLYICGGQKMEHYAAKDLRFENGNADEDKDSIVVDTHVGLLLIHQNEYWTVVSEMRNPRVCHTSQSDDGRIFVVGGEIGTSRGVMPCGGDEFWDSHKNKWYSLCSPSSPRTSLVSTWGPSRSMYIFGGLDLRPDKLNFNYTFERLDIREGRWGTPQSLPAELLLFCVTTIDHDIYLVGGLFNRDESFSHTIRIFDTRAHKWRDGSELPSWQDMHSDCIDTLLYGSSNDVPYPVGLAVIK